MIQLNENIMESDDLYQLPKGWIWVKIKEIGEIVTGTTPSKSKKEYYGNDFPFFKPTDLNKGYYVRESQDGLSEKGIKEARLLPEKSILVTCIGATIGKTGFIRTKGASNQQVNAIIPSKLIYPEFIYFMCISQQFQNKILDNASATTLPILNKSKFEILRIPLPPLPEQHRIVEKIEELFTKLDAGIDSLKKVQAQLKRYRQSVLKAAVEGKLTEEWREAHKDKLEPASVLLERIQKERREKWEAEQLEMFNEKGKVPKDGKWKEKYKEPTPSIADKLWDIPNEWIWLTFGQLFEVYVGSTPSRKHPEYWNGKIAWVSSGEVAFCKIRETKEKITELGFQNSSTTVHPPGTILLGMIGEGRTRGQAAILEIPACHNQNSAAIRVSEVGFPPEYVYGFLEFNYEYTRRIGSGNNQPALNKTRVQMIPFPVPPLAEQQEIVKEVERRLSVIEETEADIEAELKRAGGLRQSILRQAFSGKLVPQDPSDEPASVLLARIKEEKTRIDKESNSKQKSIRRQTPSLEKQLELHVEFKRSESDGG